MLIKLKIYVPILFSTKKVDEIEKFPENVSN